MFYDRVVENPSHNRVLTGYVLAHVLAHEITHILQGTCRHSDYGLMKARWDERDFRNMTSQRLLFAKEDIDLIYRGLSARAARAANAQKGRLPLSSSASIIGILP